MFILYINHHSPSLPRAHVTLSKFADSKAQFRSISFSTCLGVYISWVLRAVSGNRLACCEFCEIFFLSSEPLAQKSSTKDFGIHSNNIY